MKKSLVLSVFLAFLVTVSGAAAENICDFPVTPATPSYNSSMILVLPSSFVEDNMTGYSEPIRIELSILDPYFQPALYASMHKFNDCWICELSGVNANFNGNCGPTPFVESNQYDVEFTMVNRSNADAHINRLTVDRSQLVHDLSFDALVFDMIGNDVHIATQGHVATQHVKITLYDAVTGELFEDYDKLSLEQDTSYSGRFFIHIESHDTGVYYAAITFELADRRKGGDLLKFEIEPSEVPLSLEMGSTSYWVGETIEISGHSDTYQTVNAEIIPPVGSSVKLGPYSIIDKEYNFDYTIPPESISGEYEIVVTSGSSTDQANFDVDVLFDTTPTSLRTTITDTSEKKYLNITIENMVNETLTLSKRSQDFGNLITMNFHGNIYTLAAGSTAILTVTVNPVNMNNDVSGEILITGSTDTDSVKLPIELTIELDLPDDPGTVQAAGIEVSPGLWYVDDCLVGEPLEKSISIRNLGTSAISQIGYEKKDVNVVDADEPTSIAGKGRDIMKLTVTPESESVSGSVKIETSGGSGTLYVRMNCVRDTTDDVAFLESSVTELKVMFLDNGYTEEQIESIFYTLTLR